MRQRLTIQGKFLIQRSQRHVLLEETRSLQRTHIPGNAKEPNLCKSSRVNGTSANLLVYIDTADLRTSFS